jgi:hypothetical protein
VAPALQVSSLPPPASLGIPLPPNPISGENDSVVVGGKNVKASDLRAFLESKEKKIK